MEARSVQSKRNLSHGSEIRSIEALTAFRGSGSWWSGMALSLGPEGASLRRCCASLPRADVRDLFPFVFSPTVL